MNTNTWKVYIQPFDDFGNYSGVWTEVTEDSDFENVGDLTFQLDNTEYDIGVYRNSGFSLSLRNDHGKYSDVGQSESIFKFTRGGSLVKVTGRFADQLVPGLPGNKADGSKQIAPEVTVFTGILNDDSASMDLSESMLQLNVLGRESVFSSVTVPFSSLSNGQLVSAAILACLNQAAITKVLTVSGGNISCGIDQAIDDVSDLQNKTVEEALKDLLFVSNSVIYISGDSVVVSPRTPGATVAFNFYGQASSGAENIQLVDAIKTGFARVFNFITWEGTVLASQDITSVSQYGIKKKEISSKLFTDSTKQQNILNAYLLEFKLQKQEFDLHTRFDYRTMGVDLLSKVTIDYPTIPVPGTAPFPVCGVDLWGHMVMPRVLWNFTVDPSQTFKIMGRTIRVRDGEVVFHMREA